VALSTNQKIAIAVGVTAAIFLVGSVVLAKPVSKQALPPPRKPGLDFTTRNLDALDAVVAALVADPQQRPETLTILADQLSYYGLFAQELQLREKVNPQLRVQLATPSYGGGGATMTFRQAMAQK
jgi:hypothetical protein